MNQIPSFCPSGTTSSPVVVPTDFSYSEPRYAPSQTEIEINTFPGSNVLGTKIEEFPSGMNLERWYLATVSGVRRELAGYLYRLSYLHIDSNDTIRVVPAIRCCPTSIHHIFPRDIFNHVTENVITDIFKRELPYEIANRLTQWFFENQSFAPVIAGNFLCNLLLLPNSTHQGDSFDLLHREESKVGVNGLYMNMKYVLLAINVLTIAAKSRELLRIISDKYPSPGFSRDCYRLKLEEEIALSEELAALVQKLSPNLFEFWLRNFGTAGRVTLEH